MKIINYKLRINKMTINNDYTEFEIDLFQFEIEKV